jgi:hypothetical protein
MSPPRCPEPFQGAAEIPIPGQRQAGSDPQFVGRTSVPAAGRALVPTTALRANKRGVRGDRPPPPFWRSSSLPPSKPHRPARAGAPDPDHACAVYDAGAARCADGGGSACGGMWA